MPAPPTNSSSPGSRPIATVDELVAAFAAGGKPRAAWRIGAEHEKIGVVPETGLPAPYDGPRGIEALLHRLAQRGWTPVMEGERLIALHRGDEKVTLEPGGQLELSGSPLVHARDIDAQIRGHLAELEGPSAKLGITWIGIGFRPYGTIDDVPWVPKGRYAVMREYLPTRGRLAHEMMKRTATVQANLDYADEQDAARKFAAGMAVSSLVTALFASSPLAEGKDTGWQSWRARTWLDMDPDRCGLLPFAFAAGSPAPTLFRHYTEWALDVPMFFVYRGGYRAAGGMTFRRFLRDGFQGERATRDDWELHLSTLFPEVRLKHYLEMRSADAGSLDMVLALPVLWKGLLYDETALADTLRLTAHLTFEERQALRAEVPRTGLATRVPGRAGTGKTVLELARDLVAIARGGLGRVAPEELPALAPLDEIVATGRAPADRVRELHRAAAGDPRPLVDALRLA